MFVKINLFSSDAFWTKRQRRLARSSLPGSLADGVFHPEQPRTIGQEQISDGLQVLPH